MRILGLDHVMITIPKGAEDTARAFYCDLLGLTEIPKPASLGGRGGFWFQVGAQAVHVGVEDGIERHATRAHLAYRVDDVGAWRAKLSAAHIPMLDSIPIPNFERFECRDPFGNRLELIAPLDVMEDKKS